MENSLPKPVVQILEDLETDSAAMPATALYNEGWMLRLVLHAAARGLPCLPIQWDQRSRWFLEALLPSAFRPRRRGDNLGETWTHADGVIGQFDTATTSTAGVALMAHATQFVLLEAKMFSGLSKGTKNSPQFDQAARSVACMAETLKRAGRPLTEYASLAFLVVAPQCQVAAQVFTPILAKTSVAARIAERVARYDNEDRRRLEDWRRQWVEPLLERLDIGEIDWEKIIERIRKGDEEAGGEIGSSYERCLRP